MPSRKPARKVALTVKLPADFCAEVRAFAAREVGRPLYVASISALVEQALRRELERLNLVLTGALPMDRATGRDAPGEEPPGGGGGRDPARRPVNASTKH
jgi:hypothetical protein